MANRAMLTATTTEPNRSRNCEHLLRRPLSLTSQEVVVRAAGHQRGPRLTGGAMRLQQCVRSLFTLRTTPALVLDIRVPHGAFSPAMTQGVSDPQCSTTIMG